MFNSGNAMPSLSDIAAVTNGNDGFGGNNGWWILIILLALFGGWGYGGYGMAGGQSAGAANNYVLASDFATLQRQLSDGFGSMERKGDTINNGLCNGFYTEAQLINGLDKSAMQNTNALMTQLNTMAAADQACCCTLQNLINTSTCAINQNISNSVRNVIDNDNANYRAIDARLTAMEMSAKDDKIASLLADNQSLKFQASQEAQNTYLINQLKQCPVPAYVVPNPYVVTTSGCGCCNA